MRLPITRTNPANARLRAWILAAAPLLAILAVPAGAGAQTGPDSATVIVRLGVDTVAVESWVRTGDRLEAVSVGRAPRTVVRRYSLRFGPDGAARSIAFSSGDQPAEEREIAPAGALPLVGGFNAPFALAVREAARSGADSMTVTFLVGNSPREVPIRRVSSNVYTLVNQFGVPLEVRVDPDGRVLHIDGGGGNTVERVGWLNVEALAREFRERDERGTGLGPLSPRETVEARVHGASIAVEYSRPAARGRPVMGGLVPYGEVWRTGANEATQLRIDRPIRFGDIVVPAGAYSVFTVPDRDRWELILNGQTGQQGLQRDPARDVARVPMNVRSLAEPVERFTILVEQDAAGGVLRLRWERTEAYVPFRVESGR